MSNTEHSKKAFGISIVIHAAIIIAIATMTVQLTMPEGNVSGTIEFSAVPQGAQLTTPVVEKVAKEESPEKVKREAAPAPPPAVKQAPQISEDAIKDIETQDDGSMDVVENKHEEPETPPIKNLLPETTTKVDSDKAVEDAPPSKEPDTEAPQPAPPVVGSGAQKTVQAGNDIADLKGQERVEDRNFGASQGVRNADQFLRAVPGNKQPEYPWMARLRRIEGQVLVHFFVNANGEVSDIKIIRSTNPVFDESVLKAMKSWKFIPPVDAGIYAKPWTFQLKGSEKEKPTLLRTK